jgi:hypothetical protein
MLTIPMAPSAANTPATEPVLVIGRSEKTLRETVELLRRNGRTAGATNDFGNVLALFDASSLAVVVFGGMVPPIRKAELRAQLEAANPTIVFVQGLAGIPGLIAAQVDAATAPSRVGAVEYDDRERTAMLSLASREHVEATAFWGTAFVPPDPESTSEVIFEGVLDAGEHTIPVPAHVPGSASFLVVRVGTGVHPFVVGPMPQLATPA